MVYTVLHVLPIKLDSERRYLQLMSVSALYSAVIDIGPVPFIASKQLYSLQCFPVYVYPQNLVLDLHRQEMACRFR